MSQKRPLCAIKSLEMIQRTLPDMIKMLLMDHIKILHGHLYHSFVQTFLLLLNCFTLSIVLPREQYLCLWLG